MRDTLAIYGRLILIQIRSQLQYRVAFWFDVLGTVIATSSTFFALALVLQKFEGIGGWSLGEIALLMGLVEIGFGITEIIFSGFDAGEFGQLIRRGHFDQVLLHPVSVVWQILGSKFILRRIGRVSLGFFLFGIGVTLLNINWSWPKLLYLPLVVISQVCFFGGIFIIGATITFWTIETVELTNVLTYGITEMLSYPAHIYGDWFRRFFMYIIPAIFLNYYPVLLILDKPDPFQIPRIDSIFLSFSVGISTLIVALLFWRIGVSNYQSTGN